MIRSGLRSNVSRSVEKTGIQVEPVELVAEPLKILGVIKARKKKKVKIYFTYTCN